MVRSLFSLIFMEILVLTKIKKGLQRGGGEYPHCEETHPLLT